MRFPQGVPEGIHERIPEGIPEEIIEGIIEGIAERIPVCIRANMNCQHLLPAKMAIEYKANVK